MASKTQIVSLAVNQMGHEPVIDLDSSDKMVVAAEQALDMLLPSILARGTWRFATQIQQLTLLNETPPPYWKYVYQLPAGWLKTVRVYPQEYGWEIYESQKIYTQFNPGSQGFWMEYVFQPAYEFLPGYFVEYLTIAIATYLSLSNAEKPEYANFLEGKIIRAEAMALAIDAQNRPQNSQVNFPVLDVRGTCGVIGNSSG